MLRNLTPLSNMMCTSSEKWTGQKLEVSHLRAIGCKAFYQIDKGHRNGKFELVAYRGVLVNYSLTSDYYRVWDPAGVKVYNVGQPSFDETAVPRWWKQPKEEKEAQEFDFLDYLDDIVPALAPALASTSPPASAPTSSPDATPTTPALAPSSTSATTLEQPTSTTASPPPPPLQATVQQTPPT